MPSMAVYLVCPSRDRLNGSLLDVVRCVEVRLSPAPRLITSAACPPATRAARLSTALVAEGITRSIRSETDKLTPFASRKFTANDGT